MSPVRDDKVLALEALAERVAALRSAGKKVAHCHGCFDLMHPGHIKHLQAARRLADALVVTVTPDRFVDKGEGRPAFPERLRAESLAALECVDFVAVNRWPTAEETIRLVRPAYFVKRQEFERPRTGRASSGGRPTSCGRRGRSRQSLLHHDVCLEHRQPRGHWLLRL